MAVSEQARFDTLYRKLLTALKLQGMRDKTIDGYARAVRRLADRFDGCPDRLSADELKTHFAALVESHSWSTIKIDRNGLQFFYRHVLDRQWDWDLPGKKLLASANHAPTDAGWRTTRMCASANLKSGEEGSNALSTQAPNAGLSGRGPKEQQETRWSVPAVRLNP
jgi:hypothetical protein